MLRPRLGFTRDPDGKVSIRARAVLDGTYGDDKFPDPPVKQSDFKAALDDFNESIALALDGAKIAFAKKKTCRQKLCKFLVRVGHYVHDIADNDATVILSSGFELAGKSGPNVLIVPCILKITQGKSGELYIWFQPFYRQVVHYELRGGPEGPDGALPDPWTISIISKQARRPTLVQNLKRATTYCFQVRVYKNDETYSDWSSTVSRMCI